MEDQDQHDLAAQQAAAKDYQPIYEGLSVGAKTPSTAITDEYAKADPVYVEKTITLPQTYSHYRPIRGDGNCGWRAVGFAYFEKLIETSDQAKIEGEASRLLSFNSMLETVGGYSFADDWAEETVGLLREIANNISNPDLAHMINRDKWNDESTSASMIYHLRLLAATFLKHNSERFDPFTSDEQGVHGYCAANIEVLNKEIEQLGIIALTDVLLKSANFVLEIAYLDRSMGSQVNQYRFPEEANGQDVSTLGPMIHLLYRPDHYDILYPVGSSTASGTVIIPGDTQINHMSNFTQTSEFSQTHDNLGEFARMDFGLCMAIPGFSLVPQSTSPLDDSQEETLSQSQHSPWIHDYSDSMSPIGYQTSPAGTSSALSSAASMNPSLPLLGSKFLGLCSEDDGKKDSFRFSSRLIDYRNNNMPDQIPQDAVGCLKTSVLNKAHFGNPQFHPEEWNPEDEHVDARAGGKRKTKKSAMN